ncbi:hypothetical protein OF83DRAFT_1021723, partial [Amylostereum chailletii]
RSSPERAAELAEALIDIRSRVRNATPAEAGSTPTLVAVSKYKPASDVLACYDEGQRDFGENYVQELVDKAAQLPDDIRWHFIGTLQSNKAKLLASIPNLHTIQTVASAKAASALNKALPDADTRPAPLHVLLQVNTSGEDAKSGLPPLSSPSPEPTPEAETESELVSLARHILTACPRLHLHGLMTIGALSSSLASSSPDALNHDFATLLGTRDALQARLVEMDGEGLTKERWGDGEGRLVLSMGMSADFEAALRAGSDIVRVGTGVFGARHLKGE